MHDRENTEEAVKGKEGTEEQKEAKVLEVEWTRGWEGSRTRVYYQNTLHRLNQLEDSSEQRNLSDYTLKKDWTFKHKVEGSFVVGKLQCAVSKDSQTADKKINPIVCLIEELDSL